MPDAAEAAADEFFDANDAETVATIKESDRDARAPGGRQRRRRHHLPRLQGRHCLLDMKGACSGCPSSTATLKHGIQNLLRHFVPDVVEVRPM